VKRFVGPLALALAACQWVGDIHEKQTATCEIPSVPGPALRVGNLVPDEQRVAFCLKPVDGGKTLRFPKPRPVCPSTMAYSEFSAPDEIALGKYQIEAVRSDAECGSSASGDEIEITDSRTTVVRIGATSEDSRFIALNDSLPNTQDALLRCVHAAPNTTTLDFGYSDAAGVPAEITIPIVVGVAFGQQSSSANTPADAIDEKGYLKASNGSANAGRSFPARRTL